ncbi:MAG: MoaD/ThiS family protein [Desulfatirhabdiaceae bacterium]
MNESIDIVVNGHTEKVPGLSTIFFLIQHFQEHDTDLIVEYNGRFVYPGQYAGIVLKPGDRIEFINPNFGG